MKVLSGRNVHQLLPQAIRYLQNHGVLNTSRNGNVMVSPCPVTSEYKQPRERLTFWSQRDVNVAFLVYEALWMLAGRQDVTPLLRYVKDFDKYSDDGVTLRGAYGYRWRHAFGMDQLKVIARRLRDVPDDRRCVLQMWDAPRDLGSTGKDVPCNDLVSFQRGADGALDMTVFCRSNDIIWGCYFANAFHFSVLHEYMAAWIGCPMGVYRQVSVNFHGYQDTIGPLLDLPRIALDGAMYAMPKPMDDPYRDKLVLTVPLVHGTGDSAIEYYDDLCEELLLHADTGFALPNQRAFDSEPWLEAAYAVLKAHHLWRSLPAPARFEKAQDVLRRADQKLDMITAMQTWISRRVHRQKAAAV